MSKAQIIASAEAEIVNTSTYEFNTLCADLKKRGIEESEPIMKTISILRSQTFQSYAAKKSVLNEKATRKLKILSILTHFYGCQQYNLSKLARQLSANKEECISLLLEASINRLITVKIDEQAGKITILSSKVREREVGAQTANICADKLLQVKEKNGRVQNNLANLIKIVDPQAKQSEVGEYSRNSILQSFKVRR